MQQALERTAVQLAERLVSVIEDAPEPPVTPPPRPSRDLEADLLRGSLHERRPPPSSSPAQHNQQQLAADFEALLGQREQVLATQAAEKNPAPFARSLGAAWLH